MYALERTHSARHDLDWLPPHLKALRWTVAGTISASLVGGLIGAGMFAPWALVLYAKLAALVAAGGVFAGDRLARRLMRAQLRRLAHGSADLRRLASEADGELVHVRGRVRARDTLAGFLHGTPGVFRRMAFVLDGKPMVHEAAVDFAVTAGGEEAIVQVARARILVPQEDPADYPADKFLAPSLPPSLMAATLMLRARLQHKVPRRPISAAEFVLRDGDEVELVGYKTRTIDQTVATRLSRDTPMRATLRSGKVLPLLITPLREVPE